MRVVIDCDPGNGVPGANVDDGLALGLAVAAAERLDLTAVTIVAGNTPNHVGFAAAQTLLEDFGVEIPIFLGADRALVEDPDRWRTQLDRAASDPSVEQLWAGTPRSRAPHDIPSLPAAEVLGALVQENPGAITIVAIGPLTNVALALRLHPGFARDVGRIVVMGGVFDVDGYLVDTNFGFDPEAAAIVMASGANVTLLPMDVTTQTLLTLADLGRLEEIDNRLTRALTPGMRPWVSYSAQTRRIGGMWIHDVVAVALLLDPSLVQSRACGVTVELAPGPTRGRTARLDSGTPPEQGSFMGEPPSIDVIEEVDNDRLLHLIVDTFDAHSAITS